MGVEPDRHVCSECGPAHTNRKNLKRINDGEGYGCSSGNYISRHGETKPAKNAYARH